MEEAPTYRGGLNIAHSIAMAASAIGSSDSVVLQQRAYSYAALVEDFERVVDEAGGCEVTLRERHG
jgi:hypothetical protein